MKKVTPERRTVTRANPSGLARDLARVVASILVTYAGGHVVFVMLLGHSVVEVVAHLSMAVCAIPIHHALTWTWR